MQKYLSIILLLTFIWTPYSYGKEANSYGNVLVDEVTSIYDGDTFRANINSWPPIVGERIPVRLLGIDTPELKGNCKLEKEKARAAKQFTVSSLRQAERIELKDIQREKYFRLLADVFIDGKSLSRLLIKNGLAVEYDGGAKIDWCQEG